VRPNWVGLDEPKAHFFKYGASLSRDATTRPFTNLNEDRPLFAFAGIWTISKSIML